MAILGCRANGCSVCFIDRVFDDPDALLRESSAVLTRHEYLRLACAGGSGGGGSPFSASRAIWFRSYLTTVTHREVLDITRVRDIELLPRVFRVLAALTARELNATALARNLIIDDGPRLTPPCWRRSLLHRLPAWSQNLTARVKRRPEMHLTNTGLAAWLLEHSADALPRPGNPATGSLLETFVVNELTKLSRHNTTDYAEAELTAQREAEATKAWREHAA